MSIGCYTAFFLVADGSVYGNATPAELDRHWAKDAVLRWNSRGIVKGYPDGSLKPDGLITRAEFAALINRTFGFTDTESVDFSDVHGGDWFAEDIEKAYAAGYLMGYDDGTAQPDAHITRQEAALVLARLQALGQDVEDYPFTDAAVIPDWSRWAVMACARRGLMVGYPDGAFRPEAGITRAETVTILDRVFAEVYNEPGVYGSEVVTEVDGSVVVTAAGVILKNVTITGDLLIAQAVGDGEVTLESVIVEGTTQISGGGAHSVIVIDSILGTVTIDKENVTLFAQGKTRIDVVNLEASARIEEQDIEGEGINNVVVGQGLPPGTTVVLVGNFNEVVFSSGSVTLELEDGRIVELVTGPDAGNASIVLQQGTSVGILNLNSPANVSGEGSIEEARIESSGCTLEQTPTRVVLGEDVTATVGGSTVGESQPPVSEPQVIPVSSIAINEEDCELEEGATLQLTVKIEPQNATNKGVIWQSGDETVATVSQAGLVTAVAEGQATITVTAYDGGKTDTVTITVISLARVSNQDELTSSISAGGRILVTAGDNELTLGNNIEVGSQTTVDLNGSTQKIEDSICAQQGQSFTMVNGVVVKHDTYGKVRFDTKDGLVQTGLFENVTFLNALPAPWAAVSSDAVDEMIQIVPREGSGTYVFRNCTFINANVKINGLSGVTLGSVSVVFENCTFNNWGSSPVVDIGPYAVGTVTMTGCTFNMDATGPVSLVTKMPNSMNTISVSISDSTVNGTKVEPNEEEGIKVSFIQWVKLGNVDAAINITYNGGTEGFVVGP